jgi:hypothetical protein
MNEIEKNKQKPKLCKLAVLSPLLVLSSYFSAVLGVICSDFPEKTFIPVRVLLLLFTILIPTSIFVGILALYKIHKSHGRLRGGFMALSGIVVALLLIFFSFLYMYN